MPFDLSAETALLTCFWPRETDVALRASRTLRGCISVVSVGDVVQQPRRETRRTSSAGSLGPRGAIPCGSLCWEAAQRTTVGALRTREMTRASLGVHADVPAVSQGVRPGQTQFQQRVLSRRGPKLYLRETDFKLVSRRQDSERTSDSSCLRGDDSEWKTCSTKEILGCSPSSLI